MGAELYVDIRGEQIPIEVRYVEFWLAEFKESWKCPSTNMYHTQGETARYPGDPFMANEKLMMMGNRHHGNEHAVPFTVLNFRHIKHIIYSLDHRIIEITEASQYE